MIMIMVHQKDSSRLKVVEHTFGPSMDILSRAAITLTAVVSLVPVVDDDSDPLCSITERKERVLRPR